MISPAFIEGNYEIRESLLKERRRQIRNEDHRTELGYFSKEYDEEREMEPRPDQNRETTSPLCMRSPRVRRQRERVVGFEEAPNREGGRIEWNVEGGGPSELGARENGSHRMNLKAKFMSHFSQQKKFTKTHMAVHNIKQREGESTRAFATRYTDDTLHILGLHEDQCISGFIHGLRTRNLVEFFSTDLPSTYKGLMEKTYTWIEAREVATNGAPNDRRESFKRFKKTSRDNNRGQGNRDSYQLGRHMEVHTNDMVIKSNSEEEMLSDIKETFERLRAINLKLNHNKALPFTRTLKSCTSGRMVQYRKEAEEAFQRMKEFIEVLPTVTAPIKDLPSTYKGLMEKTCTCIEARKVTTNGAPNDQRDNFKRSLRADSKTPLVGFFGEYSGPLGEVPLEITIGEGLLTVTKTLNFVIIRSDSPHNLLLGRTDMQQMGIVVSTIHEAIKFHMPKGIAKKDEEKMAFYTREGVFCYKRLPFGLKNAGATYQRLIDKVFSCQVERNIEVNANEMVIKSDSKEEMLAALRRLLKDSKTPPRKQDREIKDEEAKGKEPEAKNAWKLFTDRASSSDGSEARLMLVNLEGKEHTYALRFEFEITNNEAKYEALLAGLRIAKEMRIQELIIIVDSQLVANQVNGLFKARQPVIKQYLEKEKELIASFPTYSIEYIKRDQNKKADAFSKLVSMTFFKLDKEVLLEVLQENSITQKEEQHMPRTSSKRYTKDHEECTQDHDRTTTNGTRRRKVPSSSHRLLHKMGRRKAANINDREAYGKIRVGIHSV
nr:reverse transcriptase domain-containing protein [Tanacetum cinerariifolium]